MNIERYINGSLKTWYISGGHCGSIASAICMRYYYDYVSTNYVPSGSIGQNALIALMQQYVGSGGTTYSNLDNGLDNYFIIVLGILPENYRINWYITQIIFIVFFLIGVFLMEKNKYVQS